MPRSIECLIGQPPAAAAVGDAARPEAVDGQDHISPRSDPIADLRRVARKAATAVQHDDRGIATGLVRIAAEPRGQSGVRACQIPHQLRRCMIRKVGKFDQTAGPSGCSAER
jgi:hypothetical protein